MQALQEFQPQVIVPVGSMAIAEVLPHVPGKLTDIIGQTYRVNPFDCMPGAVTAVPLPHPSGRSTWINQHRDQVRAGLDLLRRYSA